MMATLIQRSICKDPFPAYLGKSWTPGHSLQSILQSHPAVSRQGYVEDMMCTLDQDREYKYEQYRFYTIISHCSRKSRAVRVMLGIKLLNNKDSESEFEWLW